MLKRKNESALDEFIFVGELKEIIDKVSSACAGELMIKGNDERFAYRNSSTPIDIANVSSGIKAFSIIKTLLMNYSLASKDILIIDEPENNLHPEWQILYAELIILIQREFNLRVLLTTHSPYFLNAVEVYAMKHEVVDNCKYYLSESKDNAAYIRDVTGNIEAIYSKLAKPLQTLEDERWRLL